MGVLVNGWLVKVALICCYLFMSNILVYLAMGAKTLPPLEWEVEHTHWSPDGREGVVMTINGQFPGPTIRARAGDTVHVKLTNKLHTEGVVIHWHGIRQIGTPWADGTAFISQCPINPGETYDYVFKVDRAGTYFYHGHYGMQRSAGLYGLLIVDVAEGEEEKYKYEGEFHLLLGDWWHSTSFQQEVDLSSHPMKWIGEPQSLLINGRGQFNCSLASSTDPCHLTGNEQYAPDILKVQRNKTYRLRVASSTALSALNLAIEKHTMTVVEADGNYVAPFSVDNMDIYSGESYSVLFTTDQDPSNNYWISVSVRGREPKTPQGLTILDYNKTSISQPPVAPPAASEGPTSISQPPVALPSAAEGPTSTSQPPVAPPAASEGPASQPPSEWPKSQPPVAPRWNDYDYSKALSKKILASIESPNYHKPPRNHDWRIMMLNTQNSIDGYTKWAINNVSLVLPSTPYLGAIRYGLTSAFDQTSPPDKFPDDYDVMKPPPNRNAMYGSGVYMLGFNTTIDVILQNANALTADVSEIHPWHLHGHDFWVLGYGEGKFSEKDEENFNLENPPLRNTAVVFPYGWTAIRFVADNPGVWAFHCHIEPHLHMGMGVVFAEGVDHMKNMEIPKENFACGLTAKVLMNKN